MDYSSKYLKYAETKGLSLEQVFHKKYLLYKNKYNALKKQQLVMMGGSSTEKTVYLFKAEWCGHCQSLKPIWNELKNNANNVKFVEYDADKNPDVMKKYQIEGYPTIMMKKNNKMIEYRSERTADGLLNFINNN